MKDVSPPEGANMTRIEKVEELAGQDGDEAAFPHDYEMLQHGTTGVDTRTIVAALLMAGDNANPGGIWSNSTEAPLLRDRARFIVRQADALLFALAEKRGSSLDAAGLASK